jgi:hypothetical protein
MSINLLVMGLLALVVGSYTWKAWSAGPDTLPPSFLPFTPIPVGKSTVYVSKTKDASMYIERQRRVAILQNRPFRPSYKGFTNGSVEVGLSGLILPPQKPVWPSQTGHLVQRRCRRCHLRYRGCGRCLRSVRRDRLWGRSGWKCLRYINVAVPDGCEAASVAA